jgi:glycosyltransferase involved in cell wall biosynthesis
MAKIKISLIATAFNESENVHSFFNSILSQSKLPDEIILVDGGSSDNTFQLLQKCKKMSTSYNGKIQVIQKIGNRSVGRNEAIRNAKGDIIVCSDFGCVLSRDWIKNIVKPFKNKSVDVVAGYYMGDANTIFQKCLIPYVLVMPDRLDRNSFLPSARSLAIRKKIWDATGGMNERLADNEDFAFAKELQKQKKNIQFVQDAVVKWIPRKNMKSAFIMFYRFAKGDIESKNIRTKVLLIFLRYFGGIIFFVWNKSILLLLLGIYLVWSVSKNYKYVLDFRAVLILPALQLVSDFAVMTGSVVGLLNLWSIKKKQ